MITKKQTPWSSYNSYKVNVWLTQNPDKDSLTNSLLVAAYFPQDLDRNTDLLEMYDRQREDYHEGKRTTQPDRYSDPNYPGLAKVIGYAHVQTQLAHATYYGHPRAPKELKSVEAYIGKNIFSALPEDDPNASSETTERFIRTLDQKKELVYSLKCTGLYFDISNNKMFEDKLKDKDWILRPQYQRDMIFNNLLDIVAFGPDHPEPRALPDFVLEATPRENVQSL